MNPSRRVHQARDLHCRVKAHENRFIFTLATEYPAMFFLSDSHTRTSVRWRAPGRSAPFGSRVPVEVDANIWGLYT